MTTKIFAHRGNKHDAPENTLIAFQKALDLGVDGIETDVHLTKDGQLVIIHDEDVARTTDAAGLVNDFTLAELKRLNANQTFPALGVQRIPTLAELVQLLNANHFTGDLNLEIKTDHIHYPGIEQRVVDYFNAHSYAFHLIYSSFNLATTKAMLYLAPTTETAGLVTYHYHSMQSIDGIEHYHPEIRILRRLHPLLNRQRYFRPWTVNSKAELLFCLKRNYIGLITDYPALAIKLRNQIQGVNQS